MQVNSVSNTNNSANHSEVLVGAKEKSLDVNDFLKLLATQMQAQDPLSPMKDTEFVAQMASFTSLEQMKGLSASLESFIGEQRNATAQGYLGKQITVLDPENGGSVTGLVSSVKIVEGAPTLVINGKDYSPDMITAISTPPAPATSNP